MRLDMAITLKGAVQQHVRASRSAAASEIDPLAPPDP
jgi:hypothetical protein